MIGKALGSLALIVLALGVGALSGCSAGVVVESARRAAEASDWVMVQAKVDTADWRPNVRKRRSAGIDAAYQYTYGGKRYTSTQLGLIDAGGVLPESEWNYHMVEFLQEAKKAGRTVQVFVNPANPAQSVVDRGVRWDMIGMATPFALLFGAMALGMFFGVLRMWRPSPDPWAAPAGGPVTVRSDQGTGAVLLWVGFTVVYAFTGPLVALNTPREFADWDWTMILVAGVVLFTLWVAWHALKLTVRWMRMRPVTLAFATRDPRVGEKLAGRIRFPAGASAGKAFTVKIECKASRYGRGSNNDKKVWESQVEVRAMASAHGVEVPVAFDIPARLPASTPEDEKPPTDSAALDNYARYSWHLEARPAGKGRLHRHGFDLRLLGANT